MMSVWSRSVEKAKIPLKNGLAPASIAQFKASRMDVIVVTSFAAKLF
jgi:hypothetical protein